NLQIALRLVARLKSGQLRGAFIHAPDRVNRIQQRINFFKIYKRTIIVRTIATTLSQNDDDTFCARHIPELAHLNRIDPHAANFNSRDASETLDHHRAVPVFDRLEFGAGLEWLTTYFPPELRSRSLGQRRTTLTSRIESFLGT